MNDKQAEKVSELLDKKKGLLNHLGFFGTDSVSFVINYRVKTGMYEGHPFHIYPSVFDITEKEIEDFITHKLKERLNAVNKELESI